MQKGYNVINQSIIIIQRAGQNQAFKPLYTEGQRPPEAFKGRVRKNKSHLRSLLLGIQQLPPSSPKAKVKIPNVVNHPTAHNAAAQHHHRIRLI